MLFFTRHIKKSASIIEDIELNKMLQTLKLKLGIKKCVRLVESAHKGIPIVIGSIKPYILIPLGSLAGIPADQVETILLHELAHIRRNDFFLNLIQSFIEIVLFYHPATWWISSVIRNEREYCCDRIVLDNSGEKLNYIKALLMLSEKKESVPVNAVAATGSEKSILERIKIMANMKRKGLNRMDKLTSALMSLVVIAGIIMIVGFREPSKPAAIVTEIPESASEFLYPDSTPLLLNQVNTVQDTIRITGKVHRDFVDPTDNREKEVTLNFKNGKLIELIIDGKTIPESEYYKYDDMVNETKDDLAEAEADMAEALEDIEESLEELEEIDIKEMHAEMQEALQEIEELDIEEMLQGIEEIDIEEIQADIEDSLMEIQELEFDMQDVLNDWEEMKEEFIEFDYKNLEEEIALAMEEIKNIDIEEIKQDFRKSIEEIEGIDYDKVKKEMEEAMIKIEESMKDLEIDYRKSMEEYRKNIEKHKKEFEKQLKDKQIKEKEKEKKNG